MNNTLEQRESLVMDFIKNKNNATALKKDLEDIQSTPDIKLRKLDSECNKGISVCLDTILGKVYKDALPFEDPQRNCSDDSARDAIHDYIDKRTNGKTSEYYVREAIKRTGSSTLKKMLLEAEKIVNEFYSEKAKDIGTINIKDLNFNMNKSEEDVDKITKKLELDEISEIIRSNVEKALKDEADKAQREAEYTKKIEDSLAEDISVTDDTSMEAALDKINILNTPTIYQPSLLEAIMIKNASVMNESASDNSIIIESIHEYTKLNISKALKLERFTMRDITEIANSYING